MRTNLKHLLST